MKNLIIAFCAMVALSACSKEDALQQDMNRLRGTWDLKQITGGFAGTGYEANFTQLFMTNRNRYSLLADGSSVQEGDYTVTIQEDKLVVRFQPDVSDNISFDEFEKSVEWQDDDQKIVLSEPCCDLFVYIFERTQE